jgi:hypothetical protein
LEIKMSKMSAIELRKLINEEVSIINASDPHRHGGTLNEGAWFIPMIGIIAGDMVGGWIGSKLTDYPALAARCEALQQPITDLETNLRLEVAKMAIVSRSFSLVDVQGDFTQDASGSDLIGEALLRSSDIPLLSATDLDRIIKEEHKKIEKLLLKTASRKGGSVNEVWPLVLLGVMALTATATAVGTALGDETIEEKMERCIEQAESDVASLGEVLDEIAKSNSKIGNHIGTAKWRELEARAEDVVSNSITESRSVGFITALLSEEWELLSENQVMNRIGQAFTTGRSANPSFVWMQHGMDANGNAIASKMVNGTITPGTARTFTPSQIASSTKYTMGNPGSHVPGGRPNAANLGRWSRAHVPAGAPPVPPTPTPTPTPTPGGATQGGRMSRAGNWVKGQAAQTTRQATGAGGIVSASSVTKAVFTKGNIFGAVLSGFIAYASAPSENDRETAMREGFSETQEMISSFQRISQSHKNSITNHISGHTTTNDKNRLIRALNQVIGA